MAIDASRDAVETCGIIGSVNPQIRRIRGFSLSSEVFFAGLFPPSIGCELHGMSATPFEARVVPLGARVARPEPRVARPECRVARPMERNV